MRICIFQKPFVSIVMDTTTSASFKTTGKILKCPPKMRSKRNTSKSNIQNDKQSTVSSDEINLASSSRQTIEKHPCDHPLRATKVGSGFTCSACDKPIVKDKYLLKACDKYWHESCLKCDRCQAKLSGMGNKLYCKANMHLCRHDYLELFGDPGICSVCDKMIQSCELVMRAKRNVYHLECFACQLCNLRFCVGEHFYLCENKIVCQYDYDEHLLQMNKSTSITAQNSTEEQYHTMIDIADQSKASNVNLLCDMDQPF